MEIKNAIAFGGPAGSPPFEKADKRVLVFSIRRDSTLSDAVLFFVAGMAGAMRKALPGGAW
jgi:hypothetical protein